MHTSQVGSDENIYGYPLLAVNGVRDRFAICKDNTPRAEEWVVFNPVASEDGAEQFDIDSCEDVVILIVQ